jgi:hypothetical protein
MVPSTTHHLEMGFFFFASKWAILREAVVEYLHFTTGLVKIDCWPESFDFSSFISFFFLNADLN